MCSRQLPHGVHKLVRHSNMWLHNSLLAAVVRGGLQVLEVAHDTLRRGFQQVLVVWCGPLWCASSSSNGSIISTTD